MAAKKDFEERFFDQLEGSIDEVKAMGRHLAKKIDENTKLTEQVKVQAEKTNGRVSDLENDVSKLNKEVFNTVTKAKDLPPWYRDDKILKIIGAIIGLAAAAIGLDLSGIMN